MLNDCLFLVLYKFASFIFVCMYVSAEWEVSEALQQFWTDIKPEANKQAQLLQTVHDADVGAHSLNL